MNFLIVGAGSIGCYIGARLMDAGAQVAIVGRAYSLGPLAENGLSVSDLDGFQATVPATSMHLCSSVDQGWSTLNTTNASTNQTVVLLCVKGGATLSAAAEIAACCPPGTVIVSLQNGVDNVSRIAQAAPGMKPVAGMVPFNIVMPAPDRVHRATEGNLFLEDNATTRAVAAVFNACGLPTTLSTDMRAVQWGKLLLNLNNPVNALSDLPLVEQLGQQAFRRVLADLQTEALQVLAAAGIRPAKISKAPPHLLPILLRQPDWIFKRVASSMLRMDASARSSMWEDLKRGRITEIDDLCGAVVRLAAIHGLAAPRNAAMCRLVEDNKVEQRWTGAELHKAIG